MDSTDVTPAPAGTTTESILSAVRTLLGVAGGYLVGKGLLTQDQLTAAVPALLILGPIVWGAIEKMRREALTQVRIAAAVSTATQGATKP